MSWNTLNADGWGSLTVDSWNLFSAEYVSNWLAWNPFTADQWGGFTTDQWDTFIIDGVTVTSAVFRRRLGLAGVGRRSVNE